MEKRWYSRSPKRVLVRYSRGETTHTVFTQDVSRTGLYIETDQVYERGTLVRIEVQGEERKLSFAGRVMWARSGPALSAQESCRGMGIRCIVRIGARYSGVGFLVLARVQNRRDEAFLWAER